MCNLSADEENLLCDEVGREFIELEDVCKMLHTIIAVLSTAHGKVKNVYRTSWRWAHSPGLPVSHGRWTQITL